MTAEEPAGPPSSGSSRSGSGLWFEQLAESYRFDAELATILTQYQYAADGITLTAAPDRRLPAEAVDAPTPGLEAVFDPAASLVFVCYDDRSHKMVNPVEIALLTALTDAVATAEPATSRTDGGAATPLGEAPPAAAAHDASGEPAGPAPHSDVEMGVVTPHNAQRGALGTALPSAVPVDTVEKYQGGERDVIAVSGTVSDPEFGRREERFILNPRRLLVAISRARFLTIVVCSTALFEIAPRDAERLADGPVWARLFTDAVGRDADPAWAGSLGEFVGTDGPDATAHTDVPVQVYPSTIGSDGGEQ